LKYYRYQRLQSQARNEEIFRFYADFSISRKGRIKSQRIFGRFDIEKSFAVFQASSKRQNAPSARAAEAARFNIISTKLEEMDQKI